MSEKMKQARKVRGLKVEQEMRKIFNDRDSIHADRAQSGLIAFGDKLVDDIEEQASFVGELRASVPVTPARHADAELSRLLRMMEKRKELLNQLQKVMALDSDVARSIEEIEIWAAERHSSISPN